LGVSFLRSSDPKVAIMLLAYSPRRSWTSSFVGLTMIVLSACSDAVGPGDSGDDAGLRGGRKKSDPTAPAPAPAPPPAPAPSPPSAGNPIADASLYVAANSRASQTATAWRSTRPADAAQMDKIAAQPQASWFGNWNTDVGADVGRTVSAAAAANAVPVLVAYNIPQRDCGSYSAGGANTPDGYRSWINAFAAGIGGRRALVILEPDALPGMDCLASANQQTRLELLSYAIKTLRALGSTSVYLDAGHSRWKTAATMATRLAAAGIEFANGFSLNVSNFQLTSDQISYGNSLSALVGGKHYVIDTSRNGLGPAADGQWCNPEGRALGQRPTSATGNALVDAFLWIKTPGESDGSCNGNPSAGTWMPEYALGLAQRAAY
jgi:endoglucanase